MAQQTFDWKDNTRPAQQAKLALNILIAITVILSVISIAAATYALQDPHGNRWMARDLAEFLGPFHILLVLAGAVPIGLWLMKVCRQLEKANFKLRIPSPFAFVGWYLPFANLVIPYLSLQDAMDGFHQEHKRKVLKKGQRQPKWPVVWQVLWVLGLPLLVLQESFITDGGDGAMIGYVLQPISCLLPLTSVILLRLIVGRVSRLDAELLEWNDYQLQKSMEDTPEEDTAADESEEAEPKPSKKKKKKQQRDEPPF